MWNSLTSGLKVLVAMYSGFVLVVGATGFFLWNENAGLNGQIESLTREVQELRVQLETMNQASELAKKDDEATAQKKKDLEKAFFGDVDFGVGTPEKRDLYE
jgi:dynactin complex subunit